MNSSTAARPYGLFEVVGLEIEYAVVDDKLRPRCVVEPLFHALAHRPTSDVAWGQAELSNELAAHVLEIKTPRPVRQLIQAEKLLAHGVATLNNVLAERFGARLLPGGMHPFMQPRDTELWSRAGRDIYRTYARLFPIREHGWLNVQSCHVNLPFGSEGETVALHNATACLMPYLPALSASSPIYEGKLGPCVDNRLTFYARNQRRIPEISGHVVPEYMDSYRQYQRDILRPIYQALGRVNGGKRLRHEWVNSRGAILRFQRRAIELRVLDTQECVRMDVAIAAFVRAALKVLVKALLAGRLRLPEQGMLVDDFQSAITMGATAPVAATHLRTAFGARGRSARHVLLRLVDAAADSCSAREQAYLQLVERRIRSGSLAERIRGHLHAGGRRGSEDRIREVYEELADCLHRNVPWDR